MSDTEKKHVTWTLFTWAVGLLVVLISVAISYANSANGKADQAQKDTADNRTYITSVDTRTSTQFAEILRSLERIEKSQSQLKSK